MNTYDICSYCRALKRLYPRVYWRQTNIIEEMKCFCVDSQGWINEILSESGQI